MNDTTYPEPMSVYEREFQHSMNCAVCSTNSRCCRCDWVWSEQHPVHVHGGKPHFAVCYNGSEGIYRSGFRSEQAAQRLVDKKMSQPHQRFSFWVENWS